MRRLLPALVLAASFGLAAAPAWALNVARTSNATVLGQALDFTATIRLEGDETLRPECVTADVSLGDRALPSQTVRVQVDGVGGERRARVRTTVVVDEPIVTVVLKVGCPVQFTRSFVAFVDPPGIALAQAAPPAPSGVQPAPAEPPPVQPGPAVGGSGGVGATGSAAATSPGAAPGIASAPPAAAAPRPQRRAERPAERPSERASTSGPSVVRVPADRQATRPPVDTGTRREAQQQARVAQARGEPTSRLQLDPVAPARPASAPRPGNAPPAAAAAGAGAASGPAAAAAAPAEPSPPAAQPAPAPAVAASAAAAASAVAGGASAPGSVTGIGLAGRTAAEDEALRQLEQMLTSMRNEALSTQRSVAILQARLLQAEQERYANPLVYGLAAAVALLGLGLAFVMWKLRRIESERTWWQQTSQDGASRISSATAGADTQHTQLLNLETRFMTGDTSTQPAAATALGELTTSSMGLGPALGSLAGSPTAAVVAAAAAAGAAPARQAAGTAESRREVTVEELIDLEQQADFFIVLGQDDAAIDVLMGHLRSTGGATPLPYLKLLEIYHRRNDREAYERIRERFNRRFNAYAPEWGKDLQLGRTLDDYPAAIGRLQAVWHNPEAAMQYLEDSLLRGEDEVGTFELPAYREVLLLYSVARDIAERAQPESVDLLLPIADGPGGARGALGAARSADQQEFGSRPGADSTPGSETSSQPERRSRYETDFQFDSSAFISNNSLPPPRKPG